MCGHCSCILGLGEWMFVMILHSKCFKTTLPFYDLCWNCWYCIVWFIRRWIFLWLLIPLSQTIVNIYVPYLHDWMYHDWQMLSIHLHQGRYCIHFMAALYHRARISCQMGSDIDVHGTYIPKLFKPFADVYIHISAQTIQKVLVLLIYLLNCGMLIYLFCTYFHLDFFALNLYWIPEAKVSHYSISCSYCLEQPIPEESGLSYLVDTYICILYK